uniref:Uncharacterized protein n=1 Tax=Arundo donax TaxID=35708 RepID=A0A0A9HUI9_ARUDO
MDIYYMPIATISCRNLSTLFC